MIPRHRLSVQCGAGEARGAGEEGAAAKSVYAQIVGERWLGSARR